jgi:hypothetical protein
MMRLPRRVGALGVGAIETVFLTACGALRVPFEISAPQALPTGMVGRIGPDGRTLLQLDGLRVRLEARDPRARGHALIWIAFPPVIVPLPASEGIPDVSALRLIIFVDVEAERDGFSFAPMSATLARDGTPSMTATAFVGPGRSQHDTCVDARGRALDLSTASESFPLPARDRRCFVLAFPTASSPDAPFRLRLAGLSHEHTAVNVPELRFVKRDARSIGEAKTWRPPGML